MASIRSVAFTPSQRMRMLSLAMEAAAKLASPMTSVSPWPISASTFSSSGERHGRDAFQHIQIHTFLYLVRSGLGRVLICALSVLPAERNCKRVLLREKMWYNWSREHFQGFPLGEGF